MISSQIQALHEEISIYPQKAELVVVTKHRSIEDILELLNCGITNLGENRVQEACEKFSELRTQNSELRNSDCHPELLNCHPELVSGSQFTDYKLHLIGHLQSNKVKKAVELFDMIQSVDSEKLLAKIDEECKKISKVMPVLLQVNIFEDKQKFGFEANQITPEFIKDLISKYPNVQIEGLMTIAKQDLSEEESLAGFQKLSDLQNQLNQELKTSNLKLRTLSMGMSNDYKLALKAGATMIRVGSKVFE